MGSKQCPPPMLVEFINLDRSSLSPFVNFYRNKLLAISLHERELGQIFADEYSSGFMLENIFAQ